MSVLSKFNANAMVNPQSPEDLLLLIREANSELDNLNAHLNDCVQRLEKPNE
jgi:hypothetical protein